MRKPYGRRENSDDINLSRRQIISHCTIVFPLCTYPVTNPVLLPLDEVGANLSLTDLTLAKFSNACLVGANLRD
ncbi:MAG: pentapeptide repeat-containing protein, partial [Cyanobacteria bacterium P01_D01_bin.50]